MVVIEVNKQHGGPQRQCKQVPVFIELKRASDKWPECIDSRVLQCDTPFLHFEERPFSEKYVRKNFIPTYWQLLNRESRYCMDLIFPRIFFHDYVNYKSM